MPVLDAGIVFALSTDDGGLLVFPGVNEAVAYCEAVDVDGGGWYFFTVTGSPLAPKFDTMDRGSGFAIASGRYTLLPGSGRWLQERLRDVEYVRGGGLADVESVKKFLPERPEAN